MYNPARRVRRPLSSRHFQETRDIRIDVPSEDDTTSSIYVRNRQAVQPDALRGAMFVALIVVTIVLYVLLWELERSSFVTVPNSNAGQSVAASPLTTANLNPASRRYPHSVQDDQVLSPDEKLGLVDDQPSSKPGRITPKWPPLITRVPEEHDMDDTQEANDRTRDQESLDPLSFDVTFCNGTCRFLLPIRIGEQESKARVHFTQLLILAQKLERTIVLPNVGKSRMSACSGLHFGAYYDTNGFVRRNDSPGSWPAIDLEEFAEWVDERPALPSAFIVSMESVPGSHPDAGVRGSPGVSKDALFIVDKTEADPKILSCLESKLARLRSSLPEATLSISYNSRLHKTESDFSTRLVDLLSNKLNMDADADFDMATGPGYDHMPHYSNASYPSLTDVDVLILDYDLRHPLFDPSARPRFNLYYAPVLYDLADRLSDNLGPFLGIHWRMENVPVQNLAWCAASLVSTLDALLQDGAGRHIRRVWLATDHPRPLSAFTNRLRSFSGVRPVSKSVDGSTRDDAPLERSSTFKTLTSEHDDAIAILVEAFQPGGDLDAWKLTDLAEQLRRYPYVEGRFDMNETLLSDPGVFGILDKLVIVQAKMFVSGSTDCSKTSAFSKQIIEARQGLFEAQRGKGGIRNVVEYFGKW